MDGRFCWRGILVRKKIHVGATCKWTSTYPLSSPGASWQGKGRWLASPSAGGSSDSGRLGGWRRGALVVRGSGEEEEGGKRPGELELASRLHECGGRGGWPERMVLWLSTVVEEERTARPGLWWWRPRSLAWILGGGNSLKLGTMDPIMEATSSKLGSMDEWQRRRRLEKCPRKRWIGNVVEAR